MTATETAGTFNTNLSIFNFNSSGSFVTVCSDFLATRTEQPFNMRRIAEMGLHCPEYDEHFLVLVVVLDVKSEVLYFQI